MEEKLSKALSWALRHQGPNIGLSMTPDGYVPVCQILKSDHPRFSGNSFTVQAIREVVASSDKQRFHLDWRPVESYPNVTLDTDDVREEDQTTLCIRASQGHSLDFINPDLLLTVVPPEELAAIPTIVHGTYIKPWERIQKEGLNRMTRNHIHFAPGLPQDKTKVISGMRKSCTVYIYVDTVKCANHPDVIFYRSANGVLLTAGIKQSGVLPPEFFSHVSDSKGTVLLDQRESA